MAAAADTFEEQFAGLVRVPQQGRSRASFERMIEAAEKLLADRGTDDFTLNDVSKTGKVSIGSIYCRFDRKETLLQVVQIRLLDTVDKKMFARIKDADSRADSLPGLVRGLVEVLAETFREHAALLRPFMLKATTDADIAARGKQSYARTANLVTATLLARADEIRRPDPKRAADSAFRILYAALARYLGFGSATEAAWEGDWLVLKEDLATMLAAYLQSDLVLPTA